MATNKKIKDLADLHEGDKISITDHEWQLKSVEGVVKDMMIPSTDGVEFVRCFCYIGDATKVVTLYQSDVVTGITEIELIKD